MRTATWDEVVARRLAASHLAEPAPPERLLDVVRDTCGVHAQLMTGAELALSARVAGVTRDDVRDLLWERRVLVKAGTLRGTLHLHPAGDVALWKSLRAYRSRWQEQSWLDWQGLTLAEATRLRERVLEVLDDGEPRTREEIGAAVGGPLGARLATDSWGHYLAPAADSTCHGPPRGRQVTFVRCDRWVDGWRELDADDALHAVCRRYLATYGPARRDELERWLAARIPDGTLDGFEEIDVEGHRAFVVPGTRFGAGAPAGVRLLWHYDVYVVGCHPRTQLIPLARERVFLRGAGPSPTLVAGGRVAGVWSRTLRGRRMEIRVEPFRRLTRAERAGIADEAARVAATYAAEPVLAIAA